MARFCSAREDFLQGAELFASSHHDFAVQVLPSFRLDSLSAPSFLFFLPYMIPLWNRSTMYKEQYFISEVVFFAVKIPAIKRSYARVCTGTRRSQMVETILSAFCDVQSPAALFQEDNSCESAPLNVNNALCVATENSLETKAGHLVSWTQDKLGHIAATS